MKQNVYSKYLLFCLQFTAYISHELGNSQNFEITLRGSFSYEKYNHQELFRERS